MELSVLLDIVDRPIAWSWICRTHLPDGVVCPICGATVTGDRALASFIKMDRTYCTGHGSSFRALAAIPQLRGTEWQPEEYYKLLLLSELKVEVIEISALLGKSSRCVRSMLEKLLVLNQPLLLEAVVER